MRLHQRGLPGAVPAEDGDPASATHLEVDVEQHLARAVVGRELMHGEDGRGRWGGLRHGSDRLPGPCGSGGSRRSSRCRARCPGRAPSRRRETSRMKSRSCSTIRMEQCCLIGERSSPVTRRSSRLIPAGRLVEEQRASDSRPAPWRSRATAARRGTGRRRGRRPGPAGRRGRGPPAPARAARAGSPTGSGSRGRTGPAARAGCCRRRTARAARSVIWNLMLRPARARSAGGAVVMSRPAKPIVPASGTRAPAMHFISVLLPDPLGPMSPWI